MYKIITFNCEESVNDFLTKMEDENHMFKPINISFSQDVGYILLYNFES